MRKLINIDDLSVIYDELHRCGVLEEYQTAEFHKQAKDYVKQAKKIVEGDYQIEKDEEGYYETEISCVRKVAQKQFRCYGIKGHIADPPDGENAKSDWLFYRIDQFPPLEAGDRVRFKTSKSKINAFPDLGRARNIYPDDLMETGLADSIGGTSMIFKVQKIEEDIDFGCEERMDDEPVMAVVTLQDEAGAEKRVKIPDQLLYDREINEVDQVIFDENGNCRSGFEVTGLKDARKRM